MSRNVYTANSNTDRVWMSQLPEYKNPPVSEVVCGIFFDELTPLLTPYFGLFWDRIASEYPTSEERAPLTPTIEGFEPAPSAKFQISEVPPLPRVWFIHKSENGIVQMQRDSFLHNWRKVKDGDEYPRYSSVIGQYRELLAAFEEFLKEHGIGPINPIQQELTYVNHIPIGQGWNDISDIGNVFPDHPWNTHVGRSLPTPAERFLPTPESVNWRTSFVLPEQIGRLHISIRTATRRTDGQQTILFEINARGINKDKSEKALWEWYDLAHEWIVMSFTDLTSDYMHKEIWHRTRKF